MFAGVYDALQKKYLKSLLFCVCEAVDGPTIVEYSCKISKTYHLIPFVNLDDVSTCG